MTMRLNPPPQRGGKNVAKAPAEEPPPLAEAEGNEPPNEEAATPPSEDATAPPSDEDQAEVQPEAPPVEGVGKPAPQQPPEEPEVWTTLGSIDPTSPYRMLVTLTNRGAAVARIELNSSRYSELEDRSGYLGHVALAEDGAQAGCPVQVVGPGTPADLAGLKPGDRIVGVDRQGVDNRADLVRILRQTKPKQRVTLSVLRGGVAQQLTAVLRRRPLEVVRPEADDPLSFLLTLHQIDKAVLPDDEPVELDEEAKKQEFRARLPRIDKELDGVALRRATWELVAAEADRAVFRRRLPQWGLEVVKTYQLAKVPEAAHGELTYPSYHLVFKVEIRNVGEAARRVAYQLDGPTGLPSEGAWYASKVGPGWGLYGLRDVLFSFDHQIPEVTKCVEIATDKLGPSQVDEHASLTYLGVDAQYFSSILIPQKANASEHWFAQVQPLRVGGAERRWRKKTDTSCRVVTVARSLAPGEVLSHQYHIFAGPKRPPLLEQYGLRNSVFYGWFWWVAIPMQYTLHFFHDYIVFNYGLAIIMLTVLVRLCMFPLSRKQVLGAQKMQELQPEMKRIAEQYKKDMEARTRAQQELFQKHHYHPLSGCLPIFIQLPIFIGLYRSLMVDIELRQAPLLWNGIRWCSNLAAPDMLFQWRGFWHSVGWDWFNTGQGMFALGPYFNLLPILTIVLFVVQQKMFMPPPADEQQATQQKMMSFMFLFFGLMFFKVASGLCLYFIASSLWGVAERKLLPKSQKHHAAAGAATTSPGRGKSIAGRLGVGTAGASAGSDGEKAAARKKKRKKSRGRR